MALAIPGNGVGPWPYAKLYSRNTRYDEIGIKHSDDFGVFVDIFPVDYIEYKDAHKQFLKINLLRRLHSYGYIYDYNTSKHSGFKGYIQKYIGLLCKIEQSEWYIKKIHNLSIANNDSANSYFINYFTSYNWKKELLPNDLFKNRILVNFEEKSFWSYSNPENLLVKWYGDNWMVPIQQADRQHGKAWKLNEI